MSVGLELVARAEVFGQRDRLVEIRDRGGEMRGKRADGAVDHAPEISAASVRA